MVKRNLEVQRVKVVLLAGLFAGYFVVNLATTALAVHSFFLAQLDTALYQNALWQAGQFRNPLVDITYARSGVATHPFTGLHVMPIGFLYGLLYRFFPGMYTTAFLYALFFTLTGVFVYLSVRRLTGSFWLALGFTGVYLLAFTPLGGKFYSIEDWSACYISVALFFVTSKRYGTAGVFFLLAALGKEYFGLAIAAFGFALLVRSSLRLWCARNATDNPQRNNRESRFPLLDRLRAEHPEAVWGAVWAFAGALWFIVGFFGVMPFVEPNWVNEYMFQAVGGSLNGVLDTFRANPLFLVQRLAGPIGLNYLLGLLAPFCLLSLVGIEYLVAIIPIILINFLADPARTVPQVVSHYSTWFLPFLVVGAAAGYARLQQVRFLHHRYACGAVNGLVTLVLAAGVFSGVRNAGFKLEVSFAGDYALAAHRQDVEAVIGQIPSTAGVAAYDFLLPHLAQRYALMNVDTAGVNIAVFHPDYIICDAMDSKALADIQERARSLGLWLLNTSPSIFYASQEWKKSAVDPCPHEGYSISYQQGSVILHKRDN